MNKPWYPKQRKLLGNYDTTCREKKTNAVTLIQRVATESKLSKDAMGDKKQTS